VQDVSGTEVKGGIGWRGRGNEVPSKTLEELADGRIGLVDKRRMIGLRKTVTHLLNWMMRLSRSAVLEASVFSSLRQHAYLSQQLNRMETKK
jgi:hypothetical protein